MENFYLKKIDKFKKIIGNKNLKVLKNFKKRKFSNKK